MPLNTEYSTKKPLLFGNRIPKDYFITTGSGESDIAAHAGSYHLALKDAGIEMCNILVYSSILPSIATEIPKPTSFEHGGVMESIMAVAHAKKGDRATVGITYGWLYNQKTGKKIGGIVSEKCGNMSEDELAGVLKQSIYEVYYNGFSNKNELKNIEVIMKSFIPQKAYGTALVALCFTSYLFPIIDKEQD